MTNTSSQYPFDGTGTLAGNRVPRERHRLTITNSEAYHTITPTHAPFFEVGLLVERLDDGVYTELSPAQDYNVGFKAYAISNVLRKPVSAQIAINVLNESTDIYVSYTTVGGQDLTDYNAVTGFMAELLLNPRMLNWDNVIQKFDFWQPTEHDLDAGDVGSYGDLVHSVNRASAALASRDHSGLLTHQLDQNAHGLGQSLMDLRSKVTRLEEQMVEANRALNVLSNN